MSKSMSQYCPSCGASLDAANVAAGGTARCGQCGLLSELKPGLGSPPSFPQQAPPGFGPPPPYQTQYPPQYYPSQYPSQNPYQPPNPWGDNFQTPGYYQVADRGRALSKVAGPAILLQIYGGLVVVSGITLAASIPFIIADVPRNDQPVIFALLGVCVLFCVGLGGFTFWAAMRMKALRSYSLAMAAVIITFLIGFLACLPAMLLGIWPLIVLLDGEVKACFDRPDASLNP